MEIALVIVFFVSGSALIYAGATGPKNAQWLRYLGALVALSFGAFYTEALLISLGKVTMELDLLVAWSRFNAGIVASLALIWVLGRPDRGRKNRAEWKPEDLE